MWKSTGTFLSNCQEFTSHTIEVQVARSCATIGLDGSVVVKLTARLLQLPLRAESPAKPIVRALGLPKIRDQTRPLPKRLGVCQLAVEAHLVLESNCPTDRHLTTSGRLFVKLYFFNLPVRSVLFLALIRFDCLRTNVEI